MTGFPESLLEVRAEVEAGQQPRRRVRDLLSWFSAQRRGVGIAAAIEETLREAGLVTEPDFRTVWIDAEVIFKSANPQSQTVAAPERLLPAPEAPEYAVCMLDSANRGVVSVHPDESIERAFTLMMLHDYSQLAVMESERKLAGVIGWKSIGTRLSQKAELKKVRDATDRAEVVDETTSLFEVVGKVIDYDFVFIRKKDNTVSGIVTASDLSRQFHALAEPFLVLGRIEAHLRRLIGSAFDIEDLRAVVDEADTGRKGKLASAADLTFGEYQRLLEHEQNWKKLGIVACRKTFLAALEQVRKLRNEIVHFHPDALQARDHEPLRKLLQLLETLRETARQIGENGAQAQQ
jgi:predicted transcriptional regulator